MDEQVLAFTRASVAGAPAVDFCVDLAAGDLVAEWLMDHRRIDEPIMRVFLDLVRPGMRVLDLGCHIGTFSLPASALGAEVIAVDASPQHVRLLRHAARRNGFEALHVTNGAFTASGQTVEFIERSIHSHIQLVPEHDTPTVTVPSVTVDELIGERGWEDVNLIKMDIEGNEVAALAGMRGLFSTGTRPTIVFECNGGMLPAYDASICLLRETLTDLGYTLYLIDHLRPEVLVEAVADGVQPECASDYLALIGPLALPSTWTVKDPLSREETSTRLLAEAASDAEGYRRYSADVIAHGPEWLRSDPLVQAGFRALQLDCSSVVRAACDTTRHTSPALSHGDTPEPRSGVTPPDAVVWASGLHLRQPVAEPDLPPGAGSERRHGEVLLEDGSLYVRAGELLALYADPLEGRGLLGGLAGLLRPSAGQLHVAGPVVLLSALADGMEEALTVAENFLLFSAFVGCHVPATARRLSELAEIAHASAWIDSTLRDTPPALATRIALSVALECAGPGLLLLDELPPLESDDFQRWACQRTSVLRSAGMAVVQLARDPLSLLGAADRAIWLHDRMVRCCGHPRSVSEALSRISFDPCAHPLSGAQAAPR